MITFGSSIAPPHASALKFSAAKAKPVDKSDIVDLDGGGNDTSVGVYRLTGSNVREWFGITSKYLNGLLSPGDKLEELGDGKYKLTAPNRKAAQKAFDRLDRADDNDIPISRIKRSGAKRQGSSVFFNFNAEEGTGVKQTLESLAGLGVKFKKIGNKVFVEYPQKLIASLPRGIYSEESNTTLDEVIAKSERQSSLQKMMDQSFKPIADFVEAHPEIEKKLQTAMSDPDRSLELAKVEADHLKNLLRIVAPELLDSFPELK